MGPQTADCFKQIYQGVETGGVIAPLRIQGLHAPAQGPFQYSGTVGNHFLKGLNDLTVGTDLLFLILVQCGDQEMLYEALEINGKRRTEVIQGTPDRTQPLK